MALGLLVAGLAAPDAWMVLALAVTAASLPVMGRGLFAALSHIVALGLWPTLALAAAEAAPPVAALSGMLDIVTWAVLPGALIFLPMLPDREAAP